MKLSSRLTSDMVAEVMTQGRALKSGSFLFKYIKEPKIRALKQAYFGFIASKKNFPTAVERNRARRRARAALRNSLTQRPYSTLPSLSAFILNKEALAVDLRELASEVEQILIKTGILFKQ